MGSNVEHRLLVVFHSFSPPSGDFGETALGILLGHLRPVVSSADGEIANAYIYC